MPDTADKIRQAVREGVADGFKDMLSDKELVASFWQGGYTEFVKHSSNGASQWVGKRILTAVMGALLVWALTWYVKNGNQP